MRPEILHPLFAEAQGLDGLGPKLKKPMDRLGLSRIKDLAYHFPERFVTRRAIARLDEAAPGEQVVIALNVVEHRPGRSPRGPYRVLAADDAGETLALTYFGRASFSAQRQLPPGERRLVAGRIERFDQMWQMVHPDHVSPAGPGPLAVGGPSAAIPASTGPRGPDLASIPGRLVEPVYRLAEGLTQPRLAALVAQALGRAPDLPEWIDQAARDRAGWPSWQEAIRAAHQGPSPLARDRLAYDELFANALALMLVRQHNKARKGQSLAGDGRLRARLQLPFPLTGAQARSLAEIAADMARPSPMLRLLQGDVGAGKTVVALIAILNAVEAGAQAALLVPTELLARQHFDTLQRLAAATGISIALLTGRSGGRAREGILIGLIDGSIDLVVGTHAIFQDAVAYRNLGLVVIDEQHRFGVSQRLLLAQKGRLAPHVLAMTATPIPRTLTLARHGEMDVSRLDELPPGRQAIDTRVVAMDRLAEVVEGVARHVAKGEQAYWVCPMVRGDDGQEDLAAAEARFAALGARFGQDVVLVHGQMAPDARDEAMARFAAGEALVLVATTVIEVGVDVPAATLMVIEQAERFGLAQLHQLRGRVGRGSAKSACLLLRSSALSEAGRQRLALMRQSQDGFFLAEEDLRLRGGGELLGTRQSGEEGFRIATLEQTQKMAPMAHDEARLLIERDGGLEGPRGEAARTLLYLLERDWGVQLLRGG